MNDASKFALTFVIGIGAVAAFIKYGLEPKAQEAPPPPVVVQDEQPQAPVSWSDANAEKAQADQIAAQKERDRRRMDAVARAQAQNDLQLKMQIASEIRSNEVARRKEDAAIAAMTPGAGAGGPSVRRVGGVATSRH